MRLGTRHVLVIGLAAAVVLGSSMAASAGALAHHHLRNHHASSDFGPNKPTKKEVGDLIEHSIEQEEAAQSALGKDPVDQNKVKDLINAGDDDLRKALKALKHVEGLGADVKKKAEQQIKDARSEDEKALVEGTKKDNYGNAIDHLEEALAFKEDALETLGLSSETGSVVPPATPSTAGGVLAATPNPVVLTLEGGGAFTVNGSGFPPDIFGTLRADLPGCGGKAIPVDADARGRFSVSVFGTGCVGGTFPVIFTELDSPFQSFTTWETFAFMHTPAPSP